MHCARKEVRDVFLSQGVDETKKLDTFLGPVLSVKPTDADGKFHVTLQASDWVMTSDLDAMDGKRLEVGDIVRIGHLSFNRSMDYHAQVLEKVEVTGLANGCVLHKRGFDTETGPFHPTITLHLPSLVTLPASSTSYVTDLDTNLKVHTAFNLGDPVTSWTKRLYAYRLSIAEEWTMVEAFYPYLYLDGANKAADIKTLIENRHELRRTPGGGVDEQPYPMYKINTFSELRTDLGQYIKTMDWIKLIGYSVDDEIMSSQMQRRGMHIKQWVAMHIKGLVGSTISNEPAADHSFAVLHCSDKIGGGVHQHDSRGLHTREFHGASPLRELHIEFKTATGEPAKLRGIHLWFQICTTHG